MGMVKYDDVPSYLAVQPDTHRKALEWLREEIHRLVPDAEDTMSYGMPTVKYKGKNLVAYAGFKNHCSFFPVNRDTVEQFADELQDFKLSKGTIQFTPDKPITQQLLKKMVLARVKEIDVGGSK